MARMSPVLLSAILAGTALVAQSPQSEVDGHMAAARSAAGMDFRNTFLNLCLPSGGGAARGAGTPAAGANQPAAARGAARGAAAAGRGAAAQAPARGGAGQTPDRANWYAPPFKVFDNLYWLGTRQHSSWALQTSEGLIIIDTNFAWATEPEIIDGLTKLGLNPRDIKYVVISHAHGDHDQGAARTAEAVRGQGRDGRGGLGIDAAAAGHGRWWRADERHRRRGRRLQADARRHHRPDRARRRATHRGRCHTSSPSGIRAVP